MESDQSAIDRSSAKYCSGSVLDHVGYALRGEALHGRRHSSIKALRPKTGKAIQMGAHER